MQRQFRELASSLSGELYWDDAYKIIYATDASAYREMPDAVAIPAEKGDLLTLIDFANTTGMPLIPRAGGTSLAGQVVGKGLIVDISKRCNRILELNTSERWVRVEPGVIRDDLNKWLQPHG
ncbi:MAG: FAD-binding oxidoreductase, partial [Chitinophagia bacterium]|nr:FAD-binding oxidoreductase [Chitinophagia bacterium]